MNNPLLAKFTGAVCAALIAAEATAHFESCIHQAHLQMQTPEFLAAAGSAGDDFWAFEPDSFMARVRPYVVKNGILQIPVKGALINDFPYALGNWATGYDYIWKAFSRGMGDPDVKGIALVCDTPGGMVAGNFELVDKMFAMKGRKPIRGYASESAYSAGYSIISVCDQVTVSRTGGVGSIGVVTGHLDVSGAMEKGGLKYTYVFAGSHKVDGNPYEPLPKDVKARIQTRINALYDVFVSTVARNRGMEEQAVRDTEALTFTAPEAVENGLADAIGSLDDSLAEYAADLTENEDEEMSTQAGTVDQAAHEAAVSAARTQGHDAGRTEGHATGLKEGATAQRTRITAILASDEGKKRPKAALSAALRTDMTVEEAGAFLADLAEESAQPAAAAPASPAPVANPGAVFETAMEKTGGGAQVGAGGEAAGADPTSVQYALAAAAAYGIPGMKPIEQK